MSTQSNPSIVTPTTCHVPQEPSEASASLSASERVLRAFKGVPQQLHPRWNLSAPVYSRDEVAMAPPMRHLPQVLLPKPGRTPPNLFYGLPLSLEKMITLARSCEPDIQVITQLGVVSHKVKNLAAKCLTETIGWPVYVESVLNAPGTPFLLCMLDNLSIKGCNELPTDDHIRRMKKGVGADPEIMPLWYISAAYFQWEFD